MNLKLDKIDEKNIRQYFANETFLTALTTKAEEFVAKQDEKFEGLSLKHSSRICCEARQEVRGIYCQGRRISEGRKNHIDALVAKKDKKVEELRTGMKSHVDGLDREY